MLAGIKKFFRRKASEKEIGKCIYFYREFGFSPACKFFKCAIPFNRCASCNHFKSASGSTKGSKKRATIS